MRSSRLSKKHFARRSLFLLSCILLQCPFLQCLRPRAFADGVVRDSLGAISSGRGGANLAHEDNLSIINDNPAGLSWLKEDFRLELGSDFLFRDVDYRDPLDHDRSTDGTFVLPQFSLAGRVPKTPLTLGLGVFFPGGYGVEYELFHSIYGQQDYKSEGMLLKVLPSASIRLGDYFSIGGGVGLGYSKSAFRLPYTFQTGPLAGATGLVDAKANGFDVVWNVGLQCRPTDRLTLGAAYIEQTFTTQKGDFEMDVTGGGLPVTDTTATYDLKYNLRWPRSFAVGASYRFDWGRFSVDGVWYNWQSAFNRFRFKLSDGDNAEFNFLAGSNPTDTFPLDWHDSYSVRVGYEHYLFTNTTARIGYIYNTNPVPDRTLIPILPGILEHTLSAGLGQRIGIAEIHLAYQFALSQKQRVNTSEILGGDFNSSSIRAQAHWVFLTLALAF